ncbi:MAG: DUF3667 domain-containing protein [Bacteroidia bacterium]|nr:DUF3667 domain-containing protein [Bacteroidia bacterium]
MKCVNCGNEVEGNFCSHCGQATEVPPITFSSMFSLAFSTLTNLDRGFGYNLKQLFTQTKEFIEGYIKGKRKGILNPISFLIISISLYLIVDTLVIIKRETSELNSVSYSIGYEAGTFLKNNLKYFWILSVVWMSAINSLIWRRFNMAEQLAINSFILGQSTLLGLIGLIFFKFPIIFDPLIYICMVWMTYQVHKQKNRDYNAIVQAIGSIILFFLVAIMISLIFGYIRTRQ